MPGVDFDVLRAEVSMEQVLNQQVPKSCKRLEVLAAAHKLRIYEAALDSLPSAGPRRPSDQALVKRCTGTKEKMHRYFLTKRASGQTGQSKHFDCP